MASADGTTASQRALASLARKAVLSLWSYPNVFTDEGRANGRESPPVRQWRRSSCLTAMWPKSAIVGAQPALAAGTQQRNLYQGESG